MLAHLMIGSEGTLGFLSRVDYRTVPDYADKASAFVVFSDLEKACRAVTALKNSPVEAVELLDRAALESVKTKKGMPVDVDALGPQASALLIEARAPDPAGLARRIATIVEAIDADSTLNGVRFSHDAMETARYWDIRKGTFPAVGGKRPSGTTVIIEDVAFPVERLAEATLDLRALMDAHGYEEAIIFGHALEGNLHFVFAQGFESPDEVKRYAAFMEAVVELVVGKYDGALKAEHGTGRNMAPFVEREWGKAATDVMRRVKVLLDPQNLFNPGVVLNDDAQVHLKNLKPMPAVTELIDSCIECGFCEPQCPSKGLTLSPRQRIAASREMRRLRCDDPGAPELAAMEQDYLYLGDTTCATCSLCSTVCPLEIDVGRYTRSLRAARRGMVARAIATATAKKFASATRAARAGLGLGVATELVVGATVMGAVSGAANKVLGTPKWARAMPRPGLPDLKSVPRLTASEQALGTPVLFFESCSSRMLGPAAGDGSEPLAIVAARVFARAGFRMVTPEGLDDLCCGQSFDTKGFPEAAEYKARELAQRLASGGDEPIPVVFDASPCAARMKAFSGPGFQPLDLVEFLREKIAPRLSLRQDGRSDRHPCQLQPAQGRPRSHAGGAGGPVRGRGDRAAERHLLRFCRRQGVLYARTQRPRAAPPRGGAAGTVPRGLFQRPHLRDRPRQPFRPALPLDPASGGRGVGARRDGGISASSFNAAYSTPS